MQVFILDRKRDKSKLASFPFFPIIFFKGRQVVLDGFRESNVVCEKGKSKSMYHILVIIAGNNVAVFNGG